MKDATYAILNVGSCPTVSGRSTLTYHLGQAPDGTLHLRLHANTAAGFFSPEWVPLKAIEAALAQGGHPFTAQVLRPLFHGKSMNNAAFLLAVLLDLGLVIRSPTQQRGYAKGEAGRFEALINGDKPTKSTPGRKAKSTKSKESGPGS